jgi:hypothetical protein
VREEEGKGEEGREERERRRERGKGGVGEVTAAYNGRPLSATAAIIAAAFFL